MDGQIIGWIETAAKLAMECRGAHVLVQLADEHYRTIRRVDDEDVAAHASIASRIARQALQDALDAESRHLAEVGRTAAQADITSVAVDAALSVYLDGEEMDELWRLPVAGIRTAIEAASSRAS